ncbi:hypothetical protein ABEB36_007570 [Hypothenemus hampei]|uniref:J domain-containing protein n=1 Tax=Hypothenemus hampei TaxID=57062 RepID=A0ABD1EUF8_HYPHA
MNYKLSTFALTQVRKLSCSSISTQKNHYNSLGLTKNATQSDIKDAYYKLSKVYHPDKNQGITVEQQDQHSQKFRDISEAYEILGNVRTRRLYDKGFMGHTIVYDKSPKDPLQDFYKSREKRTRPPTVGRQPIYDFDEWSRIHYAERVRMSQDVKERKRFIENLNNERKQTNLQESISLGGILVVIVSLLLYYWLIYVKLKNLDLPKEKGFESKKK